MILVIDSGDQNHPSYVYEMLKQRGGEPLYFSTALFPSEAKIGFNPDSPSKGYIQPYGSAPQVSIEDIKVVYCLYTPDFVEIKNMPAYDSPFLQEAACREIKSALGSFFRNLDCFWVDSVHSFEQHFYKTHQLKILKENGIRIPDTLITNDSGQLLDFYEQHNRQVIYKPCWFGAFTEKLSDEDFEQQRLEALSQAPVNFQEYVPGTDVLVYLIDGEPFAAEMHADTLDFRRGGANNVEFRPVTLPDSVANDCCKVATLLDLKFAAIDLRKTPEGEYVFFEGNPSPVFQLYEHSTGYPISNRLVNLLIRHDT